MHRDTVFMVLFGWLLSAVVYLVGGIDHLFIAVTIFVGLDYITGVMSAWYRKELSSRVGWWGLARKSLTFVFVIIAHQLDMVAGNSNDFMRDAMLMFIIGTEGIWGNWACLYQSLSPQLSLSFEAMKIKLKTRGRCHDTNHQRLHPG